MSRDFKAILSEYRKPLIGVAGTVVVYAVLGFFLAPWLVKKFATEGVRDKLGVELAIEQVAINPFALSLELKGLELDDPNGAPVLVVERVFVNFQLSSLFRRAWTFREFHIDAPELYLSRNAVGEFNVAFLAASSPESETEPEGDDESDTGPPRLLISDFAVTESAIDWRDAVPAEAVETRFGPVNIAVADLNTLPDRAGQQDVVITTESSGTLSWSGSLQLNPLLSVGHASVKGSHFPLTSAYIKHQAGFEVVEGEADVEFNYRVEISGDGGLTAQVDDFELVFHDVRVRTFNKAYGIDDPDLEVLQLPSMSISGGGFRWPERAVFAQSISIDNAVVDLYRDQAGRLNIVPPAREQADTPLEEAGSSGSTDAGGDPWQLSLAEFRIVGMALNLEDQSVDPIANVGYRSMELSVRDISNEPDAAFPTTLTLQPGTAGTVSLDGTVTVIPLVSANLDLAINGVELAAAHPYLKSLADVSLDSGALNFAGNIQSSPADPVLLSGDLEVVDFLITETDEGSRLGSWTSLQANRLLLSATNSSLDVSEITLREPYADVLIAEDGSINLGRVKKGIQTVADEEETDPSEETTNGDSSRQAPPNVSVGRVVIVNAAADFADLSLPLPFEAAIAELNGELSTIAPTSAEPSTVSLEGKVDEFGVVRISGFATPFEPKANTDIKVVFENVDMPKFSAYSIPFAGREIASGRLDLDLGYKVTASELEGENSVVLRDFELGDKVEHPGALSLPLGLAVALLKDPDGRINIDLPVRGNVDDPEFRYGGVIAKALLSLVTRIVTSPFALLANLVGAEADELEYLRFVVGRADLLPPEQEKAAKLAQALEQRPALTLELSGVFDPDADGLAIREARVDARVANLIDEATVADDTNYQEQQLAAVEQLFTESAIAVDVASALAEFRSAHTIAKTEDAEAQFDSLAYTAALRRQLVDAEPVTSDELSALAGARAENARRAILAVGPALESRVFIGSQGEVSRDAEEDIQMKVSLSVDEERNNAPAAAAIATAGGAAAPLDNAVPDGTRFECTDGPVFEVRFVGPETLELTLAGETRILQREASASGAKYVGDGMEFWNKGSEATFSDNESRYTCQIRDRD